MKLGAIFRFEFAYQLRRPATWLFFAVLFFVAWSIIQANYVPDARDGWLLLNVPLVIASTTVVAGMLWLFIAASIAGDAAARDIESGLHPLSYSAPVSRLQYLAGRFLAAYALNAMILLAVPAGMLLGMLWPDVEPELLGPWRPEAFLLAYLLIALPNAFIATAVQFCFAALSRRAIVAYFGSLLLFFASMGLSAFVMVALKQPDLARLLDPVGMIAIVSGLSDTWTTHEVNTRLVGLQPLLLGNRLLWLAVGAVVLAFTWRRFRVAHPAERGRRAKRARAALQQDAMPGPAPARTAAAVAPQRFGQAAHWRQVLAIAGRSLRTLARGWTVLGPLAVVAFLVCVAISANMEFMGVPLLPRTEHVLGYLTASLASPGNQLWMIVPLLTIFYAGELVWGERDARMGEISGAAPAPEWAFFLAKFLALAAVLVAWMLVLAAAGMLGQSLLGYPHLEVGLYARVLLGLQLPDYLLFALLALAVHAIVNHKQLGTLVAMVLYGVIAFAPILGIEHRLLVFGASPAWSYSDIRGFGASLAPWLAFKAYWLAWAVLLAVMARLAWVRGRESNPRVRLDLARARMTRPAVIAGALAATAVLGLGGFIFYNTNVLNEYVTQATRLARAAAYERQYARYTDVPQPRIAASTMRVELHPDRRAAEFHGSYRLENATAQVIETLHIATSTGAGVETRRLAFDRPTTPMLEDTLLGHRIYRLATPLRPGESMQLRYEVDFTPRGFGNRGADESVAANGSWLIALAYVPSIGYQPVRELREAGDRLTQGLPARPLIPKLEDIAARKGMPGDVGMQFDAIVGTSDDQVAVAPGKLRRSWREHGRRYFHYASNAPLGVDVQFYSARYAVRSEQCHGVEVSVFHHPAHASIVDAMARSACAALRLYGRLYGPYRSDTLHLVENSERGIGAHSEPGLVDYGDGFALLNPATKDGGLDLVTAVTAHEVAHQWWGGNRFRPAHAEGAGLLVESMATYSATQVVEDLLGPHQLQAYLGMMRDQYQVPRSLAMPPLLRATEQFLNYRKGPLALHAMSQYIGRDQVNLALRRLLDTHPRGSTPLATSLDLYRELQAVTPKRYRGVLHDLFAVNAYWQLSATQAKAKKRADGRWEVTLDLRARKLVVDATGAELEQPLEEWVEIGVYPGAAKKQENREVIVGTPMYLQKHRITRATESITVVVPGEPGHVGVDPRSLLVDVRPRDNFVDVVRADGPAAR
ncbi:MAG TPA: ABC transporter permease subunit [Thermomonas sp.]|nr:ABC transporter permease subunit [Thermomonas sp.]